MTPVDFYPKAFLILYPSLENSTTGIAIIQVRDYLESKKKISKEFFRAVGEYFKILPFKTGDCHEEYASDDIHVIQLLPKPTTDHAN